MSITKHGYLNVCISIDIFEETPAQSLQSQRAHHRKSDLNTCTHFKTAVDISLNTNNIKTPDTKAIANPPPVLATSRLSRAHVSILAALKVAFFSTVNSLIMFTNEVSDRT
ncbi:hypothetical protein DPMN_071820 [Dreissena polymorpha]|uniref:Uncharacterized protein n=1 Tax=Dreissena polymorpha TaxID=45954 RepID=A0A9D4BQ01_DREPO|nr:hypothetical protein DPMN_071820 [Dreissena polymorpha]